MFSHVDELFSGNQIHYGLADKNNLHSAKSTLKTKVSVTIVIAFRNYKSAPRVSYGISNIEQFLPFPTPLVATSLITLP